MKYARKLFTGLLSIGLLTGCNFIGESYDYTPPAASLTYSELELEEANVHWDDSEVKTEDKQKNRNKP